MLMYLKLALRSLRRSPGFTLVALTILSVGIGATTAMFSTVDTVLLKPLPYRDPERLTSILFRIPAFSKTISTVPINAQHYELWRDEARTFEGVAGLGPASAILSGFGDSAQITGARVSANFFDVIGVHPKLGRGFARGEDNQGRDGVVILSDAFWRAELGGRPDAIGKTIQLNGAPHRIIGIMPPGFLFPRGGELSDIVQFPDLTQYWVPLVFSAEDLNSPMGGMFFVAIGRMKPGVTVAQASADLMGLEKGISKRFPQKVEIDPVLYPLQQLMARRARLPLMVLMAAVAAVLLIICINVMNLMMVRAVSKQREWAIELALGARTFDVIAGALCESALLAIPALPLGCLLSAWLLAIVRLKAPTALPMASTLQTDLTALLFAAGLAALSTVLFGFFPAWRASRTDPHNALQSSGRSTAEGRRGRSAGRVLVSAEVALSTVLLICACLLLRSFAALLGVSPGVNATNLTAARITLPPNQYPTDASIYSFYARLVNRVKQMPGVKAAGVVSTLPITPEDNNNPVTAGDRAAPPVTEWAMVHIHIASSGYFRAAGIPVADGHVFEQEKNDVGVMISDNLARRLWPGQSAVGRPLEFYSKSKLKVIGVVGAVRAGSLAESPGMNVYLPAWLQCNSDMSLAVRTDRAEDIANSIRQAVRQLDAQAAVPSIETMHDRIEESVAPQKFQLYLLLAFAVVALLLASLGIYGVLSFATARRTTEIGVRVALGAQPGEIVAAIVRNGMSPVLIGMLAGLGLSVALSRVIQALLFNLKALDPLTYISSVVVLLCVAALACFLPARRASRLSPLDALRHE